MGVERLKYITPFPNGMSRKPETAEMPTTINGKKYYDGDNEWDCSHYSRTEQKKRIVARVVMRK